MRRQALLTLAGLKDGLFGADIPVALQPASASSGSGGASSAAIA
jgi:hypothetical protein